MNYTNRHPREDAPFHVEVATFNVNPTVLAFPCLPTATAVANLLLHDPAVISVTVSDKNMSRQVLSLKSPDLPGLTAEAA
jgi:hypothetical protein